MSWFKKFEPGVYHVTNLHDRGKGSLREACEAYGPRRVVFDLTGTIELLSPIEVKGNYLTVDGGDGLPITVKNYGFIGWTRNSIFRRLRMTGVMG